MIATVVFMLSVLLQVAFVAPVLRDLMTSSDLRRHQAHVWCTDIHAGKTHIHTNKIIIIIHFNTPSLFEKTFFF
jgi:hypothetical protein